MYKTDEQTTSYEQPVLTEEGPFDTTMSITDMRPATDPADMIDFELFERLIKRIVEDEEVDRSYAERIVRQALVFLKACASNPTILLSPTKSVDIGWHTFILHCRLFGVLPQNRG